MFDTTFLKEDFNLFTEEDEEVKETELDKLDTDVTDEKVEPVAEETEEVDGDLDDMENAVTSESFYSEALEMMVGFNNYYTENAIACSKMEFKSYCESDSSLYQEANEGFRDQIKKSVDWVYNHITELYQKFVGFIKRIGLKIKAFMETAGKKLANRLTAAGKGFFAWLKTKKGGVETKTEKGVLLIGEDDLTKLIDNQMKYGKDILSTISKDLKDGENANEEVSKITDESRKELIEAKLREKYSADMITRKADTAQLNKFGEWLQHIESGKLWSKVSAFFKFIKDAVKKVWSLTFGSDKETKQPGIVKEIISFLIHIFGRILSLIGKSLSSVFALVKRAYHWAMKMDDNGEFKKSEDFFAFEF